MNRIRNRACVALALALSVFGIPAGSAAAALLYDQSDSPAQAAFPSNEHLPGTGGLDFKLADDFTVPTGQAWQITQVDVEGGVSGGAVPSSVNVDLYASSGSLPGATLFSARGITATNQPNYSIPLTGTPQLLPGTYWIAVQQTGVSGQPGPDGDWPDWAWLGRAVLSGYPAAMSPGAFVCSARAGQPYPPGWFAIIDCFPPFGYPVGEPPPLDLMFRLSGNATPYTPPPPPGLSRASALSAVRAALGRRFQTWRSGYAKRVSCERKSAVRFRCKVSWRRKDDRYAGIVIATLANGRIRTEIHVARIGGR